MRRRLLLMTLFGALLLPGQEAAGHKEGAAATAEHGSEAGGHAEPSILWKWANFALLAGILGWLVAKNAGPYFTKRNQEIQGGLLDAKRLREESEARVQDIERRVANLDQEMQRMREAATAEMAAEGERIRQETARTMARMQEQAGHEISSATKLARQQLRSYAAELAVDLARQRIRERMTPAVDEALVQDFVKQLSQDPNLQGSRN
jgi:F-type H+-transporting ATPase subunit b